ncbi:MAG: GNAT family N-acetyltransferase [Alphaproteobacteria bacterium]|nr:GNAT family N-acetyltransferase [Alphaproteobacteria bacterium]
MTSDIAIRPFGRADVAAFRALRLEALISHPDAFGSAAADEALLPDEAVAARMAGGDTFGAFDREQLVGMAGFMVHAGRKRRHKGMLWGVYVRPAWRGRGLAAALVDRVLAHAAGRVELVQLSVVVGNKSARRLYESRGFTAYGTETHSLKLPDGYVDELLMVRFLT